MKRLVALLALALPLSACFPNQKPAKTPKFGLASPDESPGDAVTSAPPPPPRH